MRCHGSIATGEIINVNACVLLSFGAVGLIKYTEIQKSNNHYSPFQCSYYMHSEVETNESHTIEEFLVALHRIQCYFRLIFRLK